jgi:hypothetical protein
MLMAVSAILLSLLSSSLIECVDQNLRVISSSLHADLTNGGYSGLRSEVGSSAAAVGPPRDDQGRGRRSIDAGYPVGRADGSRFQTFVEKGLFVGSFLHPGVGVIYISLYCWLAIQLRTDQLKFIAMCVY